MSSTSFSLATIAAGPSRYGPSTGSWQPLPSILNGFAIHPYHPSSSGSPLPQTPKSPTSPVGRGHRNRFSWSGLNSNVGKATRESGGSNPYEIPVEIGDEFFAFEEYRCTLPEDGRGDLWYRGYVVQGVSLHDLSPPYASGSGIKPEPSVLIGIFPAAIVHIRPTEGNDDEGLTRAYEKAVRLAEERARNSVGRRDMEAVTEENEDEEEWKSPSYSHLDPSPRKEATQRPIINGVGAIWGEVPETEKEQPPLPKLTAGDSTIAGGSVPLIDEIACAIREWYSKLPTYLANREYRLFGTVMQHIDALLLGRRQLLSQTLSADELIRVRRECVSRLVKCNVAQGLEVIVRSLDDGSVMIVEQARAFSGASWIGGIKAYVFQVQLAYIDLVPLDTLFGKHSMLLPKSGQAPVPRPFSLVEAQAPFPQDTQALHHLLLDVRAFIASPCAAGETVELYFSLFHKAENRFLTEEYCLVLNHLGSPARDAEQRLGRLRTLFINLKKEDFGGSICLICRMVRNGALRMRADTQGTLDGHRRAPSLRNGSLVPASEYGTRSNLTIREDATDDSFSVTSGFGVQRTTTRDTSVTASGGSLIDGRASYRRPLGCAVLELPPLSRLVGEGDKLGSEYSMPIYLPREEETFATLHEDILHHRTKDFMTSPKAEAIALSLRLLHGVAPQLARENPQLLLDVPWTSRLGFPDVVMPGTARNDLYIKLWAGLFFPSPASSGGSIRIRRPTMPPNQGNVQVSLEVRRPDGTVIPDALHAGGSGDPPISQFHSMVFTNTDKPTFGELVKVSLPQDAAAHLYLTFRSRSKDKYSAGEGAELERPFAFAYLPLWSASTAVKDGSHELVLYRSEKAVPSSPSTYLSAPSVSQDGIGGLRNLVPLRDRLTIRTYLASTLHSQDDTLQSLFRWQTLASHPADLATTLQRFSFVSEEELAKFVPSVLDALMGIPTANLGERHDEISHLVLKGLVKVLAMSSDRRFSNFEGVLDIYLAQHFKASAAASHLLKSMKAVMADPTSPDYRSFLKVWHLFFRFIVRGRELDRARGIGLDATSKHLEADFKAQVRSVLGDINRLMSASDKSLIGTQTLAVQHYADVLPHLPAVFPPIEIAEMVIAFADTLTHVRGSIAVYKLLLLLQVVEHAFDSAESRALLIPALVRWIKPHLGRYDDMAAGLHGGGEKQALKDGRRIKWMECARLAITVVARAVDKLQDWLASPLIQDDDTLRPQEEDSIEYCLTLLPSLCATYAEFASSQSTDALSRHRSTSAIWKETPDVFPMAHPFALIAQLPPPSLLERHHHAGEDGLPTIGTFNTGLAEAAVVVFSLLLACPRQNLLRFLLEVLDIEGAQTTSDTLVALMDTAASVLRFEAFPATWLTLSLMCFSGTIKLMSVAAEVLSRDIFIPPIQSNESFDEALWAKSFCLLCELCGSDELALEEQTQQRRRAGWIIAGDLREEGATLLLRLWNAIGVPLQQLHGGEMRYGGYQTRFTQLADRVLGLCLSSHDRMCEISVEILFSMIYAEYLLKGNFDAIETEIFAKLESIFSPRGNKASSSDPAMRAYFIAQLRAVFESSPAIDDNFHRRVSTFLEEVELFIDLLLALSELPNTPAWKDERAMATYRLTLFIKRVGRMDLYIRFVHSLLAIYAASKDWLGAGLAIRLHAEIYPWSLVDTPVGAFEEGDIQLPVQTQFARRESLYYHAIDYFAEAEAYEFALDLCQELVTEHQKQTFNIEKLSELLTHQARLWERIGQSSRPKPEYFRIAFYGEWSPINRNKDFIVRGAPWERFGDFCEGLQAKYPNATIHRSKIAPVVDEDAEEQVIWAISVSPEQDPAHPALREGVPHSIQAYHRHNGLSTFSSSRPYMPEGEVGTDKVLTWMEKSIFTTNEPLPSILSRSEVVDVKYQQISPITTATSEILKATEQLRGLTRGKEAVMDAKQLGTAINGAVDSPVSGGVRVYRKAFLDPSYVSEHPSDATAVTQLREVILDYVRAIAEALRLHKAICHDVAFHEALKNQFYRTFPEEIAQLPRLSESTAASTPHLNGHEFDYLAIAPSPIAKDSPRISFSSEADSRVLQIPSALPVPPKGRYEGSTPSTATGSNFILPPLRLGPSPRNVPTSPVSAVSSPRAATITRSDTLRSPANGLTRALSVIGSSVSNKSGGSRRSNSPVPSMGSRTTTGEQSITDSARQEPAGGPQAGKGSGPAPAPASGSRLKRLSALMKSASRSSVNVADGA